MSRWAKWLSLGVAGAGVAAVIYGRIIERSRVILERYTIRVDRGGLPPEGLTVLHISDLHCRASGHVQARKLVRLRRLLASESYDVVAVTGDLIHNEAGLPTALTVVEFLRPRLGGFSCPGNRDYWESSLRDILGSRPPGTGRLRRSETKEAARRLIEFVLKVARNERVHLRIIAHDVPAMHDALRARGIAPLVNRAFHLKTPDTDVWLAGVDDLTQGKPDLAAALAEVPEGAALILLAHNPDIWLQPGAARADLILAGHTHGGQIRLPLAGAIHTQGTHLSRRKPAGWFQRGATRMYVSRGVGESLRLRFGAPPQVTLIRLMSAR